MTVVRLDQVAIRGLSDDAVVKHALARVGQQVADKAAQGAPKASGAGAASITYEVDEDDRGAFVKVSWDRDHFYLAFHELGTSRMPARPFLRPALDAHYTL